MSICVLKNDQLTATFSTMGAEGISVKRGACEYIWQGDPTYWKGKAPMLFPICGRLFGGNYTYGGKTYEMTNHGFMRNVEFTLKSATEDTAVFELEANDETREMFPFEFRLTVTHRLKGATISTEIAILNTGDRILPCTFGAHPGFNVPLEGEGKFEDYVLEFGEPCSPDEVVMTDTCFLTGGRRAYPLEDGKTLPLRHSLFNIDAIFLARVADSVTLKSKTTERSVTLTYPDMPYLGIWHAPRTEAPYVCIEPWCGLPTYNGVTDAFEQKPDMFRLQPGAEKKITFEVTYR